MKWQRSIKDGITQAFIEPAVDGHAQSRLGPVCGQFLLEIVTDQRTQLVPSLS